MNLISIYLEEMVIDKAYYTFPANAIINAIPEGEERLIEEVKQDVLSETILCI